MRLAIRRRERAAHRLAATLRTAARIEQDARRLETTALVLEQAAHPPFETGPTLTAHSATYASGHAERLTSAAAQLHAFGRAARAEARFVRSTARTERADLSEAARDAEAQHDHRTRVLARRRREQIRREEDRAAELALDVWNAAGRHDAD